jgi:hypothetical protein
MSRVRALRRHAHHHNPSRAAEELTASPDDQPTVLNLTDLHRAGVEAGMR